MTMLMRTTIAISPLLLLIGLLLAGCAANLAELRAHPEHCEHAVQIIRAGIASGAIPVDTPLDQLDQLLHRAQAALYVGGICPAP